MGRPPKPRSEVRSLIIPIRVTKADWRELQKRAKAQGLPVSEYIRRRLDLPKGDWLQHYIKDVPEVTADGMAQVELFSELDAEGQAVQ